jgi:hypothetical protein
MVKMHFLSVIGLVAFNGNHALPYNFLAEHVYNNNTV